MGGQGPSGAPPTGQVGRPPLLTITRRLMGGSWQSGTGVGAERGRRGWKAGSSTARTEPKKESRAGTSPDSCCEVAGLEGSSASQSPTAQGVRALVQAEEALLWYLTWRSTLPAPSRTRNVPGRDPVSPGSRKSTSPPTHSAAAAQEPKELRLPTKLASQLELPGKLPAQKQPQGRAAGMLLQDPPTHGLHATWSPGQVPHALPSRARRSQGQQQPRRPKRKAPWKSQLPPIEEMEEEMSPGPGGDEERLAGPRASQASRTSHPPQVGGLGDTLGSKCLQLLPHKAPVLPEGRFTKGLSRFLPCLRPSKEDQEPADPLPEGKPAAATPHSQEPGRNSSAVDGRALEAQQSGTSFGRALRERLGLGRRLRASLSRQRKGRFLAWLAGLSCSHGVPCLPHQRE